MTQHDSSRKNKLGLDRSIPTEVKRAVRQRCGFGCVICGRAIIQYHHFDPPFELAYFHNADGITLLCGKCHDELERGWIPTSKVIEANQSPKCLQQGFASKDTLFFYNGRPPKVKIGSVLFDARQIIRVDDTVLLGIKPSPDPRAPLQFHAQLTDEAGHLLLDIKDNELRVGSEHYDVDTAGGKLLIRKRLGEIALQMSIIDGDTLAIERLKLSLFGGTIVVDKNSVIFTSPVGGVIRHNGGNVIGDIGIWLKATEAVLLYAASEHAGAGLAMNWPVSSGSTT